MKKFLILICLCITFCINSVFANIDYQEQYIQIPRIISSKNYLNELGNYNKRLELEQKYNEYWQNGNKKFDLKNYRGAINDYTQAINIKQSESLFINRGNAKYNLKDYKSAINDYTYAININPRNEETFFYRGNAKFNLNNYLGAIDDYTKTISLSPNDMAFLARGAAKYHLKKYKEAIKDFTKAIRISPSSTLYGARGKAKYKLKDYRGAIEDYTKAIQFNSKDDYIYLNRGKAKEDSGDFWGALQDYNTALKLNPQSSAKDKLQDIAHFMPTHIKIKSICLIVFLCFIWVIIQNSIDEKINIQIPECDTKIKQEYNDKYYNLSIDSQAPNIEDFNLTDNDISQISKYIKSIQKIKNIEIKEVLKLTVCIAIFITWLFTNDLCSNIIPFWIQVIIISVILYNPIKYIKIAYYCRNLDSSIVTEEAMQNYFIYQGVKELYNKNIEPIKQAEEDRLRQIREVEERRLRRTIGYWQTYWEEKQQNGFEFERAVGELYKQMGYKVNVTQGTGDGGADIEIWKDSKKGIIQCKAHIHQVGPNDIRALWGVKDDFKADYVIFVAYAGVTSGAYDFTKGKQYTILDKKDLIKMSIKANSEKE